MEKKVNRKRIRSLSEKAPRSSHFERWNNIDLTTFSVTGMYFIIQLVSLTTHLLLNSNMTNIIHKIIQFFNKT